MWDFSDDEFAFLIVAGIGAVVTTVRWYYFIGRAKFFRSTSNHVVLAMAPLLLLLVLEVVLATLADPIYVAGKLDYTLLFTAGGIWWMFLSTTALSLVGVSVRGDALERANPAAMLAAFGAMSGVMLAYAGSNVGNGPTIWTTLLPALVAAITLLLAWGAIETLTDSAEAITVERDVATGIRMGTFAACAGLVCGRAMAGDFDEAAGYAGTLRDFALLAWPVAAMAAAMVVVHHVTRPSPQRPVPSVVISGLVPAAALVALTLGYVFALGMPRVAAPGEYGQPPAVERAP